VREVDIVVGCFLMIRRALWDELGGFDLRYFMYGEEADLCLRARAMGYRPMITPEAEIMHLVGAAAGKRADKYVQVGRARATLTRDHWPRWQVPWGIAMLWLWSAGRYAVTRVPGLAGPEAKGRWAHLWSKRRDWLAGYGRAA
jgi:N-acetylglucosaminyl-diphospho-decaprenol L-rhamnosyltransferase